VARSARLGEKLRAMLNALRSASRGRIGDVRGRGLMWGLECVGAEGSADGALASRVVTDALAQGLVMLSAGPAGNVLQLAPPLVISEEQLEFGVSVIAKSLVQTSS
jgi:4-aminobutyrate aminotransferase